jgi:hypothetical protein
LDDAEPGEWRGVIVEPPTELLVEALGSVNIGHGDDVDFELHADRAAVCFGCAHVSLWLRSSQWVRRVTTQLTSL